MTPARATLLLQQVSKLASAQDGGQASDGELLHRFAARHDEAAFVALLGRQGPMVLRVCRCFLPNVHDGEDAFQAAFLTLAKKAVSLRRSVREIRAVARPCDDTLEEITARELVTVLDEELARLPEKQRAPLVLCCL